MLGMPRRIYTYDADRGWAFWNQLTTWGVHPGSELRDLRRITSGRIVVVRAGRPATIPGTPGRWNGRRPRLLPSYNFETIPVVRSRRPLWDLKHPDDPDWKYE